VPSCHTYTALVVDVESQELSEKTAENGQELPLDGLRTADMQFRPRKEAI
jgi:hypothetical protein